MEFKDSKGIFQQIADNLCDRIVSGEFFPGDKLPSVREQAASLGVNQNTIMRTYSELQREDIINNKRGVGYFIGENAASKILKTRKQDFFDQMLPEFMHQIEILKISKTEVLPLITKLEENENK